MAEELNLSSANLTYILATGAPPSRVCDPIFPGGIGKPRPEVTHHLMKSDLSSMPSESVNQMHVPSECRAQGVHAGSYAKDGQTAW